MSLVEMDILYVLLHLIHAHIQVSFKLSFITLIILIVIIFI
jgi:hypothetical protein